jgi:hypothetical protein
VHSAKRPTAHVRNSSGAQKSFSSHASGDHRTKIVQGVLAMTVQLNDQKSFSNSKYSYINHKPYNPRQLVKSPNR